MTTVLEPAAMKDIAVAIDLDDPRQELLFAQGLKLVLGSEGVMTVVHASTGAPGAPNWLAMPTVREVLSRWGVLEPGSTYVDFERLHVRVCPVTVTGDDPATALRTELGKRGPDLLVVGNQDRSWLERLLFGSIGEDIVRGTGMPSLFIGENARPLVDVSTGSADIARILIPLTPELAHQPLMDVLHRFLVTMDVGRILVTFLYCGSRDDLPWLSLPVRPDWVYTTDIRRGPVVDAILACAIEREVDLIAMATRGHDSPLDTVFGSRTERVIHRASVPVLVVPLPHKEESP